MFVLTFTPLDSLESLVNLIFLPPAVQVPGENPIRKAPINKQAAVPNEVANACIFSLIQVLSLRVTFEKGHVSSAELHFTALTQNNNNTLISQTHTHSE